MHTYENDHILHNLLLKAVSSLYLCLYIFWLDKIWIQSFRHANSNLSFDAQYAPSSIHTAGFREARVAVYGPRIYCSPKPTFVENGYVTSGCQSQRSQIFY
jgi:hypothetical protein